MKGLSHPRLMLESERRVEAAAWSADPEQQLLARRLLGDPRMLHVWECEHSRYMRTVAVRLRGDQQRAALRAVVFGLIHRKALFEHLRDVAVRADERRQVVALFHGMKDYSEAVIIEHRLHIRSAASDLCASHIASGILGDPAFEGPFGEYQRRYLEYFGIFCRVRARPAGSEELAELVLLPQLKLRAAEQRAAILALDGARSTRRRPVAVTRSERLAAA